jgi:hypothetical protein
MPTVKLGDSALEILIASDDTLKAQARFPGGKRVMSEKNFTQIEDAMRAALNLFIGSRAQSEVFQSFERLHQLAVVTLLLIYSYVRSSEQDAQLLQTPPEATSDQSIEVDQYSLSSDIYDRMYGPIGDYEVLDLLMDLGYLRNISKKRSRWAEIILTNSGARLAQAIQEEFSKSKPRLPGLS